VSPVTGELREEFTQPMAEFEWKQEGFVIVIFTYMVQRPYASMKERLHKELRESTNE
jgi:hypothetical protein